MVGEGNRPASATGASVTVDPASAATPDVYEHLIGSEEDVVGLIAYALYKRDKREWLAGWRAQSSSEPSPEFFNGFISANLTPNQRQRYRNSARQVLDNYFTAHYDGPSSLAGEAVMGRADTGIHQAEVGRGWRRSLWAGAAGAVVVVLVLVIAGLMLRYEGLGWLTSLPVAQ